MHELKEKRKLHYQQLPAVMEEIDRDMHRATDVPSQLTSGSANMRSPSTGLLQPDPTGSGDLLRPP